MILCEMMFSVFILFRLLFVVLLLLSNWLVLFTCSVDKYREYSTSVYVNVNMCDGKTLKLQMM